MNDPTVFANPTGPTLDFGHLSNPGPQFVGREAELARLDAAWEDPATQVLTLVAFGGVGKLALVARWLERAWRPIADAGRPRPRPVVLPAR